MFSRRRTSLWDRYREFACVSLPFSRVRCTRASHVSLFSASSRRKLSTCPRSTTSTAPVRRVSPILPFQHHYRFSLLFSLSPPPPTARNCTRRLWWVFTRRATGPARMRYGRKSRGTSLLTGSTLTTPLPRSIIILRPSQADMLLNLVLHNHSRKAQKPTACTCALWDLNDIRTHRRSMLTRDIRRQGCLEAAGCSSPPAIQFQRRNV